MKNTSRLKKCMHSPKFKVVLFASFLAILIKVSLNLIGFTELKFALWEGMLTRLETSVFYYGILILSLVLYFSSHFSKTKWRHIIVIALIPVNVWIILYLLYEEWIYLICGMALFVLSMVDTIGFILTYHSEKKLGLNVDMRFHISYYFSDVMKKSSGIILYTGFVTILLVVLTVTPLGNIFSTNQRLYVAEKPITYATNVRDLASTTPMFLWEPNKDKLVLLSDKMYPKLSLQNRTNALQELVNIECEYLGVATPCQLVVKDLAEYGLGGYYQDSQRLIAIDVGVVQNETSLAAIAVLLEECFHCYQADCCRIYQNIAQTGVYEDLLNEDLLFFRDCRKWMEEMQDYFSCENPSDYEEWYRYASQALETSADNYKDEWLSPYWSFINSIGEEKESEE